MILRLNGFGLGVGMAALIASGAAFAADGDAEKGKKLFFSKAQCKTCHSVEPNVKRVGPSVFNIVGQKCGSSKKQRYSSNYRAACKDSPFVWDEANLNAYLEDPSGFISKITGKKKRSPMTRKTKKAQDRADIIAYLKTLK